MSAAQAVAGLAGAGIGAYFGRKSQKEANFQNLQIYHDNKAFQERMSNTAHQRQVVDMKAAGLNPMLSAGMSGAGGASSAQPSMKAFDPTSAISQGATGVANAIVESKRKSKETKVLQDRNTREENVSKATIAKLTADKGLAEQSAKRSFEETTALKFANVGRAKDAEYQQRFGGAERILRGINEAVSSSAMSAKKVLDLFPSWGREEKIPAPKKSNRYTEKVESFGPKGEHRGTQYRTKEDKYVK